MDDVETYRQLIEDVETYRQLIERLLTENAQIPFSYGDIQIQTIFDRESDHYLIMLVGRDQGKRVHSCLVHIDIVDGDIWIQRDGTERSVTRDLLLAGVPKKRIVLGYRHPPMNPQVEMIEF